VHQAWTCGFEFSPEGTDLTFDHVDVIVVIPPDRRKELAFGQHVARMTSEGGQQSELGRGQPDGLTCTPDHVLIEINHDIIDHETASTPGSH